MFLGFHDNFRLAVLINFVLIKKKCKDIVERLWEIITPINTTLTGRNDID